MNIESLAGTLYLSEHPRQILRSIGATAERIGDELSARDVGAVLMLKCLDRTNLTRYGGWGTFFTRIGSYLDSFGESMGSSTEELPTYFLGLADDRYVTWGSANAWFDIETEQMIDVLPRPAKTTIMWNLTAQYYELASLEAKMDKVFKDIRDADRSKQNGEYPRDTDRQ